MKWLVRQHLLNITIEDKLNINLQKGQKDDLYFIKRLIPLFFMVFNSKRKENRHGC